MRNYEVIESHARRAWSNVPRISIRIMWVDYPIWCSEAKPNMAEGVRKAKKQDAGCEVRGACYEVLNTWLRNRIPERMIIFSGYKYECILRVDSPIWCSGAKLK